jgi:hypothetical protein
MECTETAEEKREKQLALKRERSKRYYAKIKAERPEKYEEVRLKRMVTCKNFYDKMSQDPEWMKAQSDRAREYRLRTSSKPVSEACI